MLQVYKDGINFKTHNRQKTQKTHEEKTLVFQRKSYKRLV